MLTVLYLFLSFSLLPLVASFRYSAFRMFFFFFPFTAITLTSLTLYLLLHFDNESYSGTNRIRTAVQLVSCHRVTPEVVRQDLLSQITWPCTHVSSLDNKINAYKEGRPSVRLSWIFNISNFLRSHKILCLHLPALVSCGNIMHLIPDRVAQ